MNEHPENDYRQTPPWWAACFLPAAILIACAGTLAVAWLVELI